MEILRKRANAAGAIDTSTRPTPARSASSRLANSGADRPNPDRARYEHADRLATASEHDQATPELERDLAARDRVDRRRERLGDQLKPTRGVACARLGASEREQHLGSALCIGRLRPSPAQIRHADLGRTSTHRLAGGVEQDLDRCGIASGLAEEQVRRRSRRHTSFPSQELRRPGMHHCSLADGDRRVNRLAHNRMRELHKPSCPRMSARPRTTAARAAAS